MHVVMTGGTGFIGRALCKRLRQQGARITVISREPETVETRCGSGVEGVQSASKIPEDVEVDAVINLAGQPIADARWTDARKDSLLQSRLQPTQELVQWMSQRAQRPAVLINASAVGYYGDQGGRTLDEESGFHDEFAHRLCAAWEQAAQAAEAHGVRVAIVRLGPVLGRNGGFLKKMLPAFKFGLGGRIGSGVQWFPWVHLDDVVSAILFLIGHPECQGIYNLTAPQPVSNQVFTETLASVLQRPAWFPVPAPILKMVFGELADLLLGGQRAVPKRLQAAGFEFQYESLKPALEDVV